MKKGPVIVSIVLLMLAQAFATASAQGQATITTSSGYLSQMGYYHVVGEVQNTGSSAVTSVLVTATFYTSGNTLLGTSSDYIMIRTLEPARKSPFDITLNDLIQSARTNRYELVVSNYEQSPGVPLALNITTSSKKVDSAGFLHVSGKIKNNGSGVAHETLVAATFYDSGGKVVDASTSYSDPTDIDVGKTASFEIILVETGRAERVNSYALEAQSTEYNTVPEFAASFVIIPLIILLALIVTRQKSMHI